MTEERTGSDDAAPPVPPESEPGDPREEPAHDTGVAPKEAEAEAEEDRVDAAPREVP